MRYVDEFRDAEKARALAAAIRRRATRRWTLMEVCGGQTHSLLRHGIDEELADVVELLHGPGCPVCVTPLSAIDRAIDLAGRPGTTLTSFGDMLRVPGSRGSLLDARVRGASVRMVYSPLDAVAIAGQNPSLQVVFFAVGFETTAPATALAVQHAAALGLTNFSVLVSHVRVQPAMEALLAQENVRIDAFLAAGHVCTITGYQSYENLSTQYSVPVVVTGFEPIDLLSGILECVSQLEDGASRVENRYARSVRPDGNRRAQQLVEEVYEVCDFPWRGMGDLPQGGLRLRAEWRQFDANLRFESRQIPVSESDVCQSGRVLSGQIKPPECPAFGRECTPDHPLGAPMVSSEGACAAYYRYRRCEPSSHELAMPL